MIEIVEWDLPEAGALSEVWAASTKGAPFCYPTQPDEFALRILPDQDDDECNASSESQKLLVAVKDASPVGFVHLCVGDVEIEGNALRCGIIRFLAFPPESSPVGRALLDAVESYFRSLGCNRIDAFSLFHGYAFHNHRVGMLSKRLEHISSLLVESRYRSHDGQLTMERSLSELAEPSHVPEIHLTVEKIVDEGRFPNIRVVASIEGESIGTCRSTSGRRYAGIDALEEISYTRWLGVNEAYRGKGYGRLLLLTALLEMKAAGYGKALLNVRLKNTPAVELYTQSGYQVRDRVFAYVKDRIGR